MFPVVVTLSYNEAARMLDGGEQVDLLPLPRELRDWMEPSSPRTASPRSAARCAATIRSRTGRTGAGAAPPEHENADEDADEDADDDAERDAAMTGNDDTSGGGFSLRRWSQRKLEAARAAPPAAAAPVAVPPGPAMTGAVASTPAVAAAAAAPSSPAPPAAALPPVESLGFDSDFAAFMQPKVDKALQRQVLKKLFADPRFNVPEAAGEAPDAASNVASEVASDTASGAESLAVPPVVQMELRGMPVPAVLPCAAVATGEPPAAVIPTEDRADAPPVAAIEPSRP